jgi:mycofactocin system glycosyltransferase
MTGLPHGYTVRLDPSAVTTSGGLLVGGSPLTAMGLSAAARRMLHGDTVMVTDKATGHLAERLIVTNLGHPDLTSQLAVGAEQLTVVIPVRDRPVELDRALAALAPLSCIVVDDASEDPAAVAEVVRRHVARLLALAANVGPAGARNAGADQVRTPFVAFVDSDVEVTADGLLLLARHFADPRVALVAPRIEGIARSPRPRWFERYDAVASSLTVGRRPASVGPGRAVAWLPSACLVARTPVAAGAFDETLRVGEDVDLVWRLVAAGQRVRFDPSVVARHDTRATLRGWLGRKMLYGTSAAVLAERHPGAVAPAVIAPVYAVAAAALLVRRRWSVPLAGVALGLGTRKVRRAVRSEPGTVPLSARLAAQGMGWAVRQEAALLVRHWWPATAVGLLVSHHVRRATVTALLVDTAVVLVEHRNDQKQLSPALLALGRRLDDAAYGVGLWRGALRRHSPQALLPRRPRRGTQT